ncbi:MAG: 2-C-methyl-D-erythritol 4-phosphate cytidylyltransferase [Clostridiales bacterium]|nr:2-C-methyl-D-erythritol 4-phosphate cytidylyltransferase [Clostridiales bacterium]
MNIALIFAGGTGSRINSRTRPKQFLELNGKPIIIHTLEYFEEAESIDAICVVCLEGWIAYFNDLVKKFNLKKIRWVVPGGDSGQDSIFKGLTAVFEDKTVPRDAIMLIHDGVRPLISVSTVEDVVACACENGNAITVTSAYETIITVDENENVSDVVDRKRAKLARAPQAFHLNDIYSAHIRAREENFDAIDSATLMRHFGHKLFTVEGPVENIKITSPSDFYIFRAIYEARENSQIWGL